MTFLFLSASGLGAYDKAVVRDDSGEIIGKDLRLVTDITITAFEVTSSLEKNESFTSASLLFPLNW